MERPWLKHYDEGVPATIDYPPIPLDQFLTDAAAKHPGHRHHLWCGGRLACLGRQPHLSGTERRGEPLRGWPAA